MPQASNSSIPPAYDGGKTSPQRDASTTEVFPLERRGVFPFSWSWQLAGLIAAMVTGLLVVGGSVHYQAPAFLLLAGLGILGISVYSAVETNWLRNVSEKPLPVKIGAGTAVICGLVPIGVVMISLAIGGAICALVFGALLGAFGSK